MVFISSEEYKELLETKFKYDLEHKEESCNYENTVEEPRKFKAGDKVKVKELDNGTGTIKFIGDNEAYIKFDSEGYCDTYYHFNDIELIKEREEIL